MKATSFTALFLRRQRRRSRGTLLAWAAAVAGFAEVWSGAVRLDWIEANMAWCLIPAALSACLLIRWSRRVWRLDDRAIARELDGRWGLDARLESTVELAGDVSMMAAAQRADTAELLTSKKPVGTVAWLSGMAAAAIAFATIGIEQSALWQRSHRTTAPSIPLLAAQPTPITPAALPPPEPLRATLEWKSPEPSVQAQIAEEIPLIAHAVSNKGFRSVSLKVAVNGSPTHSYPLSAAEVGLFTAPGESDLKLSLFLDETGAQPYDVVLYHLRGEANFPPDFPAVFSSQQFVEILPVNSTPADDRVASATARDLLNRLLALKQAQLKFIERNFDLIHAPPDRISFEATTENAEVAVGQTRLAHTAEEVRAFAAEIKSPDLVPESLAKAGPLMTLGGDKIAMHKNDNAAPLQAQALTLIIEAERALRFALSVETPLEILPSASTATPAPPTSREQTPAGRLERLAQRQKETSQRLQSQPLPTPEISAVTIAQVSIVRELEKLESEHALIAPVQKLLTAATDASREAARQLGLGDLQAAREPAVRAQALLQRAVELQDSEGRKAAAALLAQIRQDFNRAARLDDAAAFSALRRQAQLQLKSEAARQIVQGSGEAAKKLTEVSDRVADDRPGKKEAMRLKLNPNDDAQPPAKKAEDKPVAGVGVNLELFPEYTAELGPTPAASGSMGSGKAKILLVPGLSNLFASARLDVTFENLSSTQTSARLVVENRDGTRTPVFALRLGKVSGQSWAFQPIGDLSHDAFIEALKAGRLFVEIGSATYPGGELDGAFLREYDVTPGEPGGPFALPSPGAKGRAIQGQHVTENAQASLEASTAIARAEAFLSPALSSAQAIRQLKAAAARLSVADDNSGALALLEKAAQAAQAVSANGQLGDTAHNLALGAGARLNRSVIPDQISPQALADQALELAKALEEVRTRTKRDEWAHRFSPEEIDPIYRKPVENYFEQLSRESAVR